MSIKSVLCGAAFGISLASPSFAQDPMSAIDWLSESIAAPPQHPLNETAPTDSAAVEDVTVALLDAPKPDAVGLLPTSVTGLPKNLWGIGQARDIAREIRRNPVATLPALSDLSRQILLAEASPPRGAQGQVLLARIDKLLEIGALDDANALIEQAGPNSPELFKRWFDVSLLLGVEDRACQHIKDTGAIAPSIPVRIFCLARNGDWNAAVLTLNSSDALGLVTEEDYALIARFLDPDLFEGEPSLTQPSRPTPIMFLMFDAIGEPLTTHALPRAFAHADLRSITGWKARIEAAERLARFGAIRNNQLLGIYSERKPAASGGVWERVAALQHFEQLLRRGDREELAPALQAVWSQLEEVGLQRNFAALFAAPLMEALGETDEAGLVFRVALLSDDYETYAAQYSPQSDEEQFLQALARGFPEPITATNAATRAVKDGFDGAVPTGAIAERLDRDRLGEAILLMIHEFDAGTEGDMPRISNAIRALRFVGLENVARKAALQYLILGPDG